MAKKNKRNVVNNRRSLVTLLNSKSPVSEQYRTIRTNIQFSSVDQEIRSIMVTSAGPGEGKSTTIANLAVVFAQQGKKVLLIDADLRKPTVHYTFNQTNTFGLTTVLTKQMTLEKVIVDTEEKNLFVLTSGPIPPNPAELLSSKAMEQFFQEALEVFDIILFDTPPLLAVTDAQILANKCEGTILVVSSGKTESDQAVKAKEMLDAAQGKLLGVVLNNKKLQNANYYYYYGGK
ncbi:CpsD/CapB family tyrosine-protein kinase [Bacillus sp. USDA818B3_A]|uniref:CpsD/CapB family tyrosine-protein kinase n=1 Tax=Bacillus sp. USDA818B3_A TaxID=2698834 RepID=UPI0013699DE0|nr:CpsD/CapB family tyrosine-protein kinase [Bacillus sp. USDA818B3_A]